MVQNWWGFRTGARLRTYGFHAHSYSGFDSLSRYVIQNMYYSIVLPVLGAELIGTIRALRYGPSKRVSLWMVIGGFVIEVISLLMLLTELRRDVLIPIIIVNSILTFLSFMLYLLSMKDDDDDDIKRDIEKVRSKVILTKTGLKVVPVRSN